MSMAVSFTYIGYDPLIHRIVRALESRNIDDFYMVWAELRHSSEICWPTDSGFVFGQTFCDYANTITNFCRNCTCSRCRHYPPRYCGHIILKALTQKLGSDVANIIMNEIGHK